MFDSKSGESRRELRAALGEAGELPILSPQERAAYVLLMGRHSCFYLMLVLVFSEPDFRIFGFL